MNLRLQRLFGQIYRAPEAGDGAAGGAGAAGAGGDAGAAGAAGAANDGKGAEPSLLSQGDPAAIAAAAAGAGAAGAADPKLKPDPLAWLPEKYRVKGDDGAVKVEDSAKKLAEAYGALNKRMVDTGLPPESPDKYEFKAPEGKESLELDAAMTAEAKKGLHGLGLTQKQYQGVMEMYVNSLEGMVTRGTVMGAAKATEALAASWGQPDTPTFKANLGYAKKAFDAFADDGDKAAIDKIGNDPVTLRILAKIGRELQEDTSGAANVMAPESLETLMKDPAYMDPRHARHAEVKAKVTAHFQTKARAEDRRAA